MDVEILARVQFAITVMFHYIYPPLSIGLGLMLVIFEGMYVWTHKHIYLQIAKFWTRIFALTFAIGVATGIVMEFEFGTNWSAYSKYVGDVFGSALAAEGVFAFFLESGFLALVLFGWNRVSARFHYFSTIMMTLGAHFSAIWIVVANSWMHTPAGFHIVEHNGAPRAEIVDFWAMVFNPSAMDRLGHVVVGCWLAGSFLVLSVSAFYLLKKRHQLFAKICIQVSLIVSVVCVLIQGVSGDRNGKMIAVHQPAKLASFEGLFTTQKSAPLYLFGIPNTKEKRIDYGISIPFLLSVLAFDDAHATVQGLDRVPEKDWPNVAAVFPIYRIMIGMWLLMLFASVLGLYYWRRGCLFERRGFLRLLVLSVLFPQIANQTGWMATEMGRYPWIVQDLLRISQGLSKIVTAEQVLGSLIMFTIVYLFLFAVFIYMLDQKIRKGPTTSDEETAYHKMGPVVQ